MQSRAFILTSVVVTASLATAGCGGGASPRTATTAQNRLVAYSHCMRSHGIPNFPDPAPGGGIPKDKLIRLIPSPRFSAASNACQRLMPAAGLGPQTASPPRRARLTAGLAFARCMRQRGFPSFPDPTAQGQLTPQMVSAAGIDLHQPALLHAGLACVPVTHGLISRGAVQRAVNGE